MRFILFSFLFSVCFALKASDTLVDGKEYVATYYSTGELSTLKPVLSLSDNKFFTVTT